MADTGRRVARRRRLRPLAVTGAIWPFLVAAPALAQDFEETLMRVCEDSATGQQLGDRCNRTIASGGGPGDISADSNSSLDGGQLLSLTDATLSRAHGRQRLAESRMQELRDEEDDTPGRGSSSGLSLIDGDRWSVLLNGRAQLFRQEAAGFERQLEGETFSFQLGTDVRLADDIVVGGLFSYDRTDSEFGPDAPGSSAAPFDPPDNDGNLDTNAYSWTLFGSFSPTPSSWIDLSVGGGFEQHRFRRNGLFQIDDRFDDDPIFPVAAVGEPDGWHVSVAAGAGYDYESGALRIGPYTRVSFVHTEIDSYTEKDESGSGLILDVDSVRRDSLVTLAGLRASYAISTKQGVVLPSFRFEFAREWERDPQDLRAALAQAPGSDPFENTGEDPDRNYQNLGIGLLWVLPNGWMPFVDFQTVLNRADWGSETITAGLRLEL